MDIKLTVLARKYAQAYLNLFGDQLSEKDYQKLQTLSEFIEAHRQTVFFLGLQSIAAEDKEKIIFKLVDQYNLPISLKKLISALIKNNRAALIGKTLAQICELYRKNNRIMLFQISSSCPLEEKYLHVINKFLTDKTGLTIISKSEVKKDLIAGLRLQSNMYLWEYSIKKQINRLTQKGCS